MDATLTITKAGEFTIKGKLDGAVLGNPSEDKRLGRVVVKTYSRGFVALKSDNPDPKRDLPVTVNVNAYENIPSGMRASITDAAKGGSGSKR